MVNLGVELAAFLKKSGAKNFCYSGVGFVQRQWSGLTKVVLVPPAGRSFLQAKNIFQKTL
jgi:hypothetical protein